MVFISCNQKEEPFIISFIITEIGKNISYMFNFLTSLEIRLDGS